MLKAVVIIVAILTVLVAALLVYAATRPDRFRVQRALSIKAPPEKIFALVNDLRGWGAWSPYEKKDPDMKRTYSGAASGKGAVYEWDGDKNVGKGRMEITDTSPRPRSSTSWISSVRSKATTPPSSRWNPKATPQTSPGPCSAQAPSSRR